MLRRNNSVSLCIDLKDKKERFDEDVRELNEWFRHNNIPLTISDKENPDYLELVFTEEGH